MNIMKYFKNKSELYYWLVLAISLVWFCIEFFASVGLKDIPWSGGGRDRILMLVMLIMVIHTLLLRYSKLNVLSVFISIALAISYGAVGLEPILTIAFMIFSATVAGEILFNIIGIFKRDLLHRILHFSVGSAIYALVVSILVYFPINYKLLYLIMLIAPLVVRADLMKHLGIQLRTLYVGTDLNERLGSGKLQLLSIVSVVIFFTYFLTVLMPEVGYDALASHLAVPSYVSEHQMWTFDVTKYVWAVMPMNVDWVYTFIYMLAGESAVRILNFIFLLSIIGLIIAFSKEYLHPKIVFLSVISFLSLPIVYLVSTTLFVENFLTLLIFGGVISIFLYDKYKEIKYLLVTALLLGAALGTKSTTALIIIPIVIISTYYLYKNSSFKDSFRIILACAALLMIVGSVPYLSAYLITGNPVFPLYNAIFKSPFYADHSFNNSIFNRGIDLFTLRDLTFSSQKYIEGAVGSFGWLFFVILPITIIKVASARIKYSLSLIVISVVFIILVFNNQSYIRYIYPVMPLLILLIFQGIEAFNRKSYYLHKVLMVVISILVFMNFVFLSAANWGYQGFDIKSVFSTAARDQFIDTNVPIRRAIEYVNNVVDRGAVVGIFSEPKIFGLKGTPIFANWYNYDFGKDIQGIVSNDELIDLLKSYGINKIILSDYYKSPNEKLIQYLKDITNVDIKLNNHEIRSLKSKYKFINEILVNPNFKTKKGWNLSSLDSYNPKLESINVSYNFQATQTIKIKSSRRYKLEVSARCIKPESTLRLQINWHDDNGKFINTNITPVTCKDNFKIYQDIFKSPSNATTATVYAAIHSDGDEVEFKYVSLKE